VIYEEAAEIAYEQKRYWKDRGWTAQAAWEALTKHETRASWGKVVAYMIRWQMAQDKPRRAA
jgi:hypothetical protein